MSDGIACPHCGRPDSTTIDSRPAFSSRRRRRQCQGCGAKFTTFEVSADRFRMLRGVNLDELRATATLFLDALDEIKKLQDYE